MATTDFLKQAARRAVTDAIARAEGETSAEIVVVVRRASGTYRAAHLTFGAICALATLVVLLVSPTPFGLHAFVVDVALVFVVAALIARKVPSLGFHLTPAHERETTVKNAASAVFLERGVHRCEGRNGVLVYASVLERAVEIVADLGVDRATLAPTSDALAAALREGDVAAFAERIATMGGELKTAHPRRAEDVDELSNDVVDDDPARA